MTPRDDQLGVLLRAAADDVLDRDALTGPDTASLWGRGRRTTWAARSAAAGIVGVLLLLVVAGGVLLSGPAATVPSQGGALTYPEVVSDMFPQPLEVSDVPIFGLVATLPTESESSNSLVIERSGVLARLRTAPGLANQLVLSNHGTAPPLAPDGKRVLTDDGEIDPVGGTRIGILDLTDGSLSRPISTDPVIQALTGSRGVWSPDSRHVLVDTVDGPAVLDGYADTVLSPAEGDREVRAAGWRDDTTLLGVRLAVDEFGLDIVARGLSQREWSRVATVAAAARVQGTPSRVFASPDGSRLLLVYPAGSGPARTVLVDARTGARVAFTGESPSTSITWDDCDPVWQAGQPLLAYAGLRHPATGESVMSFSGHRRHGCVALAGNELTGTPAPGAAGAWQERAWQLWTAALPVGGVLALVGLVWMVVALRRSRRHGEDFLPMVLRLPF